MLFSAQHHVVTVIFGVPSKFMRTILKGGVNLRIVKKKKRKIVKGRKQFGHDASSSLRKNV